MTSDSINQIFAWFASHPLLIFTGLALVALAFTLSSALMGGRAWFRFLNNYVQSRQYHFINAELPFLLDAPLRQLTSALNSPSMQRGADGVTDMKEFKQRSLFEKYAFYCDSPLEKIIIFHHSYTVDGGPTLTSRPDPVISLNVAKLACGTPMPSFRLERRSAVTLVETLVNKALDVSGAPSCGHPVDFSDHPEFAKQYVVFALDVSAARAFFGEEKMAALMRHPMQGKVTTNQHYVVYMEEGNFSDAVSYDSFIGRATSVLGYLVTEQS